MASETIAACTLRDETQCQLILEVTHRIVTEAAEITFNEAAEKVVREKVERMVKNDEEKTARQSKRKAREEAERLATNEKLARDRSERETIYEAERLAIEESKKVARERAARAVKEEAERLVKEKADLFSRAEAERVAREDAARLAREEVKRFAREEAEILDQENAEKLCREEAERLASEEAERVARAKAKRLFKEEAGRLAAERVAERLAREEVERVARAETEHSAKAERLAREEDERLAAERVARAEAERLAREEDERLAAERVARAEAEWLAREEVDRVRRDEAERVANRVTGRVTRENIQISESFELSEENGSMWKVCEIMIFVTAAEICETVAATALEEESWEDYAAMIAKDYDEKVDDEGDDLREGELSVHDEEIENVEFTALSRDLDGDAPLEMANQSAVAPAEKVMGDVRDMFRSLFTPSLPTSSTQTQTVAALPKHSDQGITKNHNSKKKSRVKRTDLVETTKISCIDKSDKDSSKPAAGAVHLSAHPQSQAAGHEARAIDDKLMRLLNEKVWFSLGSYPTLTAAKAARREIQHLGQGVKVRCWRDSSRQCWVLDTNSQGLKFRRQVGSGQGGVTAHSPPHHCASSVSSSFIAAERDVSERNYCNEVDQVEDGQEGKGVPSAVSLKLPRIKSMSAGVMAEGDTGSNKGSLWPLPSLSKKGET